MRPKQDYPKRMRWSPFHKLRQRTNLKHLMTVNECTVEVRSNKGRFAGRTVHEDSFSDNSDSSPRIMDESIGSKKQRVGCGLNWQLNERAMLIKDARGDWCLMFGHWSGFKRVPELHWSRGLTTERDSESADTCTTHGYGGHLSLRMLWFAQMESRQSFTQVPDSVNSLSLVLQDAVVNIQNGIIHISKNCQDVAQNVCLAFCCSLLHVLCQPRILTHEQGFSSVWDSGLVSSQPTSTFRPQVNNFCDSTQDFDAEPPSNLTASTSFDSNNIMQLIENPLMGGRKPTASISKAEESTPGKLCWTLSTTIPADWEVEKRHLIDNTVASSSSSEDLQRGNSVGSISAVEILGHALIKPLTVNSNEQPIGEWPIIPNGSPKQLLTRGPINSLDYTLCRACGFPVDTLIPSVQLTRYIDRSEPLKAFFPNLPSDKLLSEKVPSNKALTVPHIKQDERSSGNNTTFKTNFRTDPVPSDNSLEVTEQPRMKQSLLGWKLVDFYDYFLLELPDACSGCKTGCQYCCGIDLL